MSASKAGHAIRSSMIARRVIRAGGALALAAALLAPPVPVQAEPPPWAPAHGYRAKQAAKHHDHRSYYGPRDVFVVPDSGGGFCNRELMGQILGAAAGGLGGSQIGKGTGQVAAVIAGVIVGGVLGGEIGRSMDEADLACAGQSLEYLPTGRTAEWNNPDTGARYSLEPTETYRTDEGRYCRRYTAQAVVGGRVEDVKGIACRRADDTWEIVG